MKIAIVTSGHPPFDERIFYKFGISLTKYNHDIAIICSTEEINTVSEGIKIAGFEGSALSKQAKADRLFNEIKRFGPALVICCEPLTILAAHRYRKQIPGQVKVVYDITEYYPHQNMLNKYSWITRFIHYTRFSLFNYYVSNLADYLFIGEEGKSKLYNFFAPTVRKAIISYYPPQKYFQYSPPVYDGRNFTFCYTGNISIPGGFTRFIKLIEKTAERFSNINFTAKIIGDDKSPVNTLVKQLSKFQNVNIVRQGRVNYENYSVAFKDVDLCVDLRDKNIVFNRSLPIKVFDYMGSGKTFIASNLDSFKGFEDIKEAGLLIEPDDINQAVYRVELYLKNPDLLRQHSLAANRLFKEKYNWEILESKLAEIIDSMFR